MREEKVDKLIAADFEKLPDSYLRKINGNVYQRNGTVDYLGGYKGQLIGIEAKAGNGHKLGMGQLFDGYQIAQAGGLFVVAYPDYTSILDLKPVSFGLELHANKANQLSDEEYDLLEKFYKKINKARKTCAFVK